MPIVAPAALRVTNWTSRTLPATRNWKALGWATGTNWAVLSDSNTTGAYTTNNGQSWSTNTITSGVWNAIATDPGSAIMVACNNTTNTTTFLRSTDNGVTWGTVAVPAAGANIAYPFVAFGGGNFVSVGGNGSVNNNRAIYSSDGGATWGTAALSDTQNWQCVAYDSVNAKFIAISSRHGGNSNSTSVSSDGGATWSAGGTVTAIAGWVGVASANGTTVATTSSTTWSYSTDGGASWSSLTGPFGAYGVTYGGGVWVAVNTTGTSSAWSYDGTSWTTGLTLPSSKTWIRIASSGANFLTASFGGNDTVAAMLSLTSAKPSPIIQSVNRAAVF